MPVDRGENSLFHLLAVTSSSFILFPISYPTNGNGKAPLSPSPSPSFGPQRRTIICAPILAVGTHPARKVPQEDEEIVNLDREHK